MTLEIAPFGGSRPPGIELAQISVEVRTFNLYHWCEVLHNNSGVVYVGGSERLNI